MHTFFISEFFQPVPVPSSKCVKPWTSAWDSVLSAGVKAGVNIRSSMISIIFLRAPRVHIFLLFSVEKRERTDSDIKYRSAGWSNLSRAANHPSGATSCLHLFCSLYVSRIYEHFSCPRVLFNTTLRWLHILFSRTSADLYRVATKVNILTF